MLDGFATIIQRAWRRYAKLRIFQYYRDLVRFAERSEPQAILKLINPREAGLCDGATGTLVRFRLAGGNFPPQVVYKIFTQRPVLDLGAFAPRDYVVAKQKPAKFYTLNGPPPPKEERVGWYTRCENNNWRPVVQKLARNFADVLSADVSSGVGDVTVGSFMVGPKRGAVGAHPGTAHFDYQRQVRTDERQRRRKLRQVEWLTRMYREGRKEELMHQSIDYPSGSGFNEPDRPKRVAISTFAKAVDDIGDDELLEWTQKLNFEEYFRNWALLGTTARSDHTVQMAMHMADKEFLAQIYKQTAHEMQAQEADK